MRTSCLKVSNFLLMIERFMRTLTLPENQVVDVTAKHPQARYMTFKLT